MYSFVSNNKCSLYVLSLVTISIFIDVVYCASSGINSVNDGSNIGAELQKELRLTKIEKHALDKLKLVLPKELLRSHLRTELFQIRWLRAHSLDVDRAVRELNQLIKLRRKQQVPNFWKADWSDLFPKHPFAIDGFDKTGLPVVTLSIGEIDLRRIVMQGKREKLFKYFENVGFEVLDRVNDINMKQANITQAVLIINMDGFNTIQHTCPLCLTFFIHIFELSERSLPGFCHDFVVINAPSMYGIVLDMVRPTFSDNINRVLRIYDTNRNKWKPYLDSIIDPSQLPWEYGGTKVVDRDN